MNKKLIFGICIILILLAAVINAAKDPDKEALKRAREQAEKFLEELKQELESRLKQAEEAKDQPRIQKLSAVLEVEPEKKKGRIGWLGGSAIGLAAIALALAGWKRKAITKLIKGKDKIKTLEKAAEVLSKTKTDIEKIYNKITLLIERKRAIIDKLKKDYKIDLEGDIANIFKSENKKSIKACHDDLTALIRKNRELLRFANEEIKLEEQEKALLKEICARLARSEEELKSIYAKHSEAAYTSFVFKKREFKKRPKISPKTDIGIVKKEREQMLEITSLLDLLYQQAFEFKKTIIREETDVTSEFEQLLNNIIKVQGGEIHTTPKEEWLGRIKAYTDKILLYCSKEEQITSNMRDKIIKLKQLSDQIEIYEVKRKTPEETR